MQALQLLHAGKRADLRERNTPRALPRLVVAGLLGDREAQTLLGAYRFWRRLEHRVQVRAARSATGCRRRTRRGAPSRGAWGLPIWPPSTPRSPRRGRRVEAIAATLGEPPPEAHLAAARLLDPMRDRDELERRVTAAGFRDVEGRGRDVGADRRPHACGLPRGSDRLPQSRSRAGAFPRPRAAGLGRAHGALARSPEARSHVGDAVRDQRSARRAPGAPPGDVGAVPRRVGRAGSLARGAVQTARGTDRRRDRRRRRSGRGGRGRRGDGVARHPLVPGGGDPAHRPSTTWPAACKRSRSPRSSAIWRKRASRPGSRRRCRPSRRASASRGRRSPCSASGAWAPREMRYGSDLDLVFLYGGDGESDSGVDHREWFARASQRSLPPWRRCWRRGASIRSTPASAPRANRGCWVTSWTSFERYHSEEAAAWERVALPARARRLDRRAGGDARRPHAGAGVTGLRSAGRRRKVRADLRRVRGRVERERGKVPDGSRHLHFDPGGIMDVELLVALGQLRHAADPEIRTTSTAPCSNGWWRSGGPPCCATTTRCSGERRCGCGSCSTVRRRVVSPRDLPALARSLGTTSTLLAAELDERMARVRGVFAKYF